MNIAISGASGFIGKHLTEYLTEAGHRVIPLGRPMFREGTSGHLIQALSHCDVIINLAGAPIGKRWTPEYKKELYDSRIKVTHCIIRAMDAVKTKPRLMISASAVGYYPEEGHSMNIPIPGEVAFWRNFVMHGRKRPAVVRRRQGW